MTIGAKKNVAWALAILGLGATYFFVYICALARPPDVGIYYLWPAIGTILSLVSFIRLRSYYRKEPPPPPGAFRLQLTDLIALSISFAVLMSILKALLDEYKFSNMGPLLAFGVVSLWTGGMLAASLRALFSGLSRYAYAFVHALRSFGWMTVGAISAVVIFLTLNGRFSRAVEFLLNILGSGDSLQRDEYVIWYLRTGLIAWVLGTVLLHQIEKRLSPPSGS
jgi:hypothetical protein